VIYNSPTLDELNTGALRSWLERATLYEIAMHEAAIAAIQAQERPDREGVLTFLREGLARDRASLAALLG
jgi:hypothetical protein